jgi:hypothetical protein
MNNIILLEQTHTGLKKDYVWQHYTSNNIHSYVLVSEKLQDNEILKVIESKLPNIIDINNLSSYLQLLINECNQSCNEMWFVEKDDDFYLEQIIKTNGLFELELQKEVERYGLSSYITFYEDDCFITVYGGISEKINFN